MTPDPGGWPLSAAATAVLREPRTPATAVLSLAVRELVARGALRAETGHAKRRRARVPVLLGPGEPVALPRPLALAHAAMQPQVAAGGVEAAEAVRRALGRRRQLLGQLVDDARADLRERGLLVPERRRVLGLVPVTRWRRTPTGSAWVGAAAVTPGAGVVPAVGLLLLLEPEVARALGRDTGVDLLLSGDLGAALDAAVDSGADAGGDGGGD